MSRLLIALFIAAGLSVAGCATQRNAPVTAAKPMAPVAVAPISKDAYDIQVRNAETQNKMDKDACSSRNGNAKDICLAEANGKEKALAEFNNPKGQATQTWNEIDTRLADTMSSYWVNFIMKGDPNGSGLPVWPAFVGG